MILRNHLFILSIIFFGACHHIKKTETTTSKTEEPAIQLDTLDVVANKKQERVIYQGSTTRANDILHTKLEVDFDWKACRMNGKATLRVKPYFFPVNWLYLNARGMEIKKVEVFEVTTMVETKSKTGIATNSSVEVLSYLPKAAFVYENDSIKINFGQTFADTEVYVVVIDYVAKPNELKKGGGSAAISEDKGLYFINPTGENPYKMPQIWTQGETQSNSAWFPTIDSPNERMTQEIFMTVDEKYTTLSNGILVNSVKKEGGKRTDYWKMDLPHAPYLAMMAVGEFVKVTDQPWNGKDVSYYVEKEYAPYAKEIFGDTKEMIDFFSKKLGVPYAWPKYSQIAVRDYVSGAMENTSATLHGDFVVYQKSREMIDGKKGTDVISHELFHQWFGDLVTCESWSNLPLNESFATYGEYLWREYKDGRDAADDHSWQSRQGYLHSDKEANLIRFNYKDREDMFDGISYNKGGQILHMLRKAVGDDAFFASLKYYLETNRFQPVEVHNLRLAFEAITGEDLNWFFDQWFLNKGRPNLKVSVKQNVSANLELTIEQKQDLSKAPLYRLPIEVDLYVNGKADRRHLVITDQIQTFTFVTSGAVQLVNFDAERQLLCDLEYTKSIEEYVFQYKNAPLYGDRLEALKGLEENFADPAVRPLFVTAATQDKFFQLRNFAIGRLEKEAKDGDLELKTIMISIYNDEKKTVTRAKALHVVNKRFGKDADIVALNEKALKEPSYAICSEAFETIARQDPQKGMIVAKQFENESGKEILFPVAALYATHGGDDQALFFHQALNNVSGFELMSFCAYYSKVAQKFKVPSNALMAAKDMENLSIGANKYVRYAVSKAMKEISTDWENREKIAREKLELAKKEFKPATELEQDLISISETRVAISKSYDRVKLSGN
ncbi:MAG: M1 family metallopeptidase [bacterium]|nr:M1 family metallopeptidase [bacterium]